MTRIFVPSQNDPELQELRRNADILFNQVKARKRLYDLYFDISLESIEKLQLQYDEAERLCQLKRKELGLPYIMKYTE